MLRILLVALFTLLVPFTAYAAEDDPAKAEAEARKAIATSVREKVADFTKDLEPAERGHFTAIYNAHNLTSVVKIVQEDVDNAVKACTKENPDLADSITARHDAWKAEISPVLKDAQGNINNMIAAQDYAKPKKIRSVLKFADDARAKTNKDIEKIPVTSPEACESLRDKMDDTQDQLTKLLQSTLVSLPRALESSEEL